MVKVVPLAMENRGEAQVVHFLPKTGLYVLVSVVLHRCETQVTMPPDMMNLLTELPKQRQEELVKRQATSRTSKTTYVTQLCVNPGKVRDVCVVLA